MSADIQSLIPQKPPFVMVGELLLSDDALTKTSFKITETNVLTADGFFTEAGLLENIAQTAAARAGQQASNENRPVDIGYIASVKNLEIFQLPKINDELLTEVRIEDQVFDMTVISGIVKVGDKTMASCTMNILTGK